jgi:asparagine synthase (glutamine-hydrolysing)
MGITGWIHTARDLRDQREWLGAMAAATGPAPADTYTTKLGRRAGFAVCGMTCGYVDWRSPGRPDPDVVLVADVQLANRTELLGRLETAHPLASDAELLLRGYRQWGAGLVDRIDGAFAIAIWDDLRQHLLLIRDPLGKKTLFYYPARDGGLVFASRLRALLIHPDIPRQVTADGLNELLTLGPVRTPGHGVIRGVHEVLPGHISHVTPGGVHTQAYWRWHAGRPVTAEASTGLVRRTVAQATAPLRQLPGGTVLLSGGIASAAAAAMTAPAPSIADRPAGISLTVGGPWGLPPGAGANILAAQYVAAHLRLRHHVFTGGPAALIAAAGASRRVLDLPGESNLDAPLFAMLRQAAQISPRVVTGSGANALFGGLLFRTDLESCHTFAWRRDCAPVDLLSAEARLDLLPAGYRKQRYDDAIAGVEYLDEQDPAGRAHRRAAWLTLTHYLPAQLNRLDQLAAAAGVSVHTPFADVALAQHLLNVPYGVRHRSAVRNGLLRHAVADLLPASIVWRPGRSRPVAHLLPEWRRHHRVQLRALLGDPAQPLHAMLDHARIGTQLAQPTGLLPEGWHSGIAYLLEVNAWLAEHRITVT